MKWSKDDTEELVYTVFGGLMVLLGIVGIAML